MNEIIKNLLDQSTHNVLGVNQVNQQKFAELIVRECANVIHKQIGPKSALDVLGHFELSE
jgi:hypothetical protein